VRHLPNLICLIRLALIWPVLVTLHAVSTSPCSAVRGGGRLGRPRRLPREAFQLDIGARKILDPLPTNCCWSRCLSNPRGSGWSPVADRAVVRAMC